jgi:hypothetical protein
MKNQPMVPSNGQDRLQFPSLHLNFFYLVTPFAPTGEGDHMLLGKTMQVLYDNATVFLRGNDIVEELRIILCRLTLEELTRIWDALREPYRLSVCYQIRVTSIDSQRIPGHARVIERLAGFGQQPTITTE